ncbi:MAG: HoxN/HupN/NixA family nickel/cobalt transporter [Methylocella sp.]
MFANIFCLGGWNTGGKIAGLYAVLIGLNAVAWGWALAAFHNHPVLLGTALLAYTFGLRHAVDADHIAAIDNVTRKLMQEGKRPVAAGFFFSLGHSTVVVLLCIAVATATLRLQFDSLKEIGGVAGTSVSALFLFAIAMANIYILISLYGTFAAVRQGQRFVGEDLDVLLVNRGYLARWAKPLFRVITNSWQMYPLGFLFGLGFDTATEIGLLGVSATQVSQGLSIWSTLVFAALFTAAMALVDTTDAILMLGAYGWAFIKPIRKLYYNLTITFISVVVAFLVGGVEVLGLLEDKLALKGAFWNFIGELNGNFGTIGFLIIGLFIVSWAVSALVYEIKGYDKIEVQ